MNLKIALAGNPNSGKTTLFNALTGANQFVGNWPGVTVEKKEGKLKKDKEVVITDLPGIYSLSPYSPEEVVARNYLAGERPDAILNIVDATNLERNLYLTLQLLELGIPTVVALNMMDAVKKSGDKIDAKKLEAALGCPVVEISALKGTGIEDATNAVLKAAKAKEAPTFKTFSEPVEKALEKIDALLGDASPDRRFLSVKLFEKDTLARESFSEKKETLASIDAIVSEAEKALDDDTESVITDERYNTIASLVQNCYKKKNKEKLSASDKIDRVVTNRWLGLPIFAAIMFLVYWISMVAVGTPATDWVNDGVFGDGYHLFGIGDSAYEAAAEEYGDTNQILDALVEKYGDDEIAAALDAESEDYDEEAAKTALATLTSKIPANSSIDYTLEDEETLEVTEETADYEAILDALSKYGTEPDPADFGVWVPGVPVLLGNLLEKANAADWLSGLILDGIVAGVGAVLGFVPQMLVLFLLLAILEACGYMARIAFVLDRIFRRFGLSGKSFIPMLIGTGCGIPGIMASRTIENEKDRRMTVMTTTFIPCSAKIPFIGMIAGAIFGGSAWVATSAYFIGMLAIITSGVMLKKTKPFSGDPAPFVMELPSYHLPTVGAVLRSTWERGWSFIKKAGTVILLSTILVWFTSFFGFTADGFRMLAAEELDQSILAKIGGALAWIFAPLGFGTWQATVASFTGLVAKENIVGTMGILYGSGELTAWQALANAFTGVSAYAFLAFNLLCAPCFAAMGAIRREMNSAKWTWFAIGYQCAFAYVVALMINQFGNIFIGKANVIGIIFAVLALAGIIYMLFFKKQKAAKALKTA
ncbi:MAG: ferrous iron transporter B [Clostridia bacterium]|nr:ferrous iron transporter B [Clostridia bacterium]